MCVWGGRYFENIARMILYKTYCVHDVKKDLMTRFDFSLLGSDHLILLGRGGGVVGG